MKSASLPMTLKTNELTLFGIKFKQKVSKPRIGRLLVFIFLLLTFWACPKPEPIIEPPRDTTIHLELIDTWTTSVTLKISVEDTTEAWNFALSRNGSIVHEGFVDKADTVLVDEGLGVATDYSYSAYFIENANIKDSSLTITTTTMDTTSHDFTWTIDTLGTYGGRLNDVHIVNEDDIWVVGQIIMDDPDSSWNGTGTETFNAAHWDGIEWEMIKISNGTAEAKAIHYFSEDDIWSTYGGYPAYWDGNEWKWYHLHSMGIDAGIITSIWGTSSDNMYFVGYNGGIVHYDGANFTIMESGTDVNLREVHGSIDRNTDELTVWATGWGDSNLYNSPGVLLKYVSSIGWQKIIDQKATPFDVSYRNLLSSVFSISSDEIMITANSSVYNLHTSEESYYFTNFLNFSYAFIYDIAGNSKADLMIAGDYVNLWHYNGFSWFNYADLNNDESMLISVDIKDNVAVAVGSDWTHGYRAIVYKGTRQN